MKYRFVIQHLSTDRTWFGKFTELSADELLHNEIFMKDVCKGASYVQIELESGDDLFLPGEVVRECAFFIEPSKEK